MRKKIVALLTIMCVMFAVLGVACGKDEKPEHSHTYESAWTYDNTYHWHKASCEHTSEISEKAEHAYAQDSNSCSICGYVNPTLPEDPQTPFDTEELEKVIGEVVAFMQNGVSANGNVDIKYKDGATVVDEQSYEGKFIAALVEKELSVDAIAKISDTAYGVMLLRNASVALASTDSAIADFAALKQKVNDLEFIPYPSGSSSASLELVELIPSLLEEEVLTELPVSLVEGLINYFDVEEVKEGGKVTYTIDLIENIEALFAKATELGAYIDDNYQTKTLSELYNSNEFKAVVNPLLDKLSAEEIKFLVTYALELTKPMGVELPISVVEVANNDTAYSYIAKYLDLTIEIGENEVAKIGEMPLNALLGEFYSQEGASLEALIEGVKESLVENNLFEITFVKEDSEEFRPISLTVNQTWKYYDENDVLVKTEDNIVELLFTYGTDKALNEVKLAYTQKEDNKVIGIESYTIKLVNTATEKKLSTIQKVEDYTEENPFITENYSELGLKLTQDEKVDSITYITYFKNNNVEDFRVEESIKFEYTNDGKFSKAIVAFTNADSESLVTVDLVLANTYDSVGNLTKVELNFSNKEGENEQTLVEVSTFNASVTIEYTTAGKLSAIEASVCQKNGEIVGFEGTAGIEFAWEGDNVTGITLYVEEPNPMEVDFTFAYDENNKVTVFTVTVKQDDITLGMFGATVTYNREKISHIQLTGNLMGYTVNVGINPNYNEDDLSGALIDIDAKSQGIEIDGRLSLNFLEKAPEFIDISKIIYDDNMGNAEIE